MVSTFGSSTFASEWTQRLLVANSDESNSVAVMYLYLNGVYAGKGCNGVLISPKLVLTARHCVERGNSVRISFGKNENRIWGNSRLIVTQDLPRSISNIYDDHGNLVSNYQSDFFEILNRDGNPKEYKTNDGQVISFVGTKNTLYIVETEASFEKRDKVQAKHNREGKATGRYLAIANYDLFKQSIEFYEIENSNGEKTLARRGFFVGRAIRP